MMFTKVVAEFLFLSALGVNCLRRGDERRARLDVPGEVLAEVEGQAGRRRTGKGEEVGGNKFRFDCTSVPRRPPQNGVTWDINQVTLEKIALGNNVYMLTDNFTKTKESVEMGYPAPTTGGYIVTDAGIVVIETYLNNHVACQARDIIEKEGKPIKFVVCTSNHGDHCYGSSVFDAPGVTFVLHSHTKKLLQEPYLSGDKAFMEYGFGAGGGIAETNPITADMVIHEIKSEEAEDTNLNTIDTSFGSEVVIKFLGMLQTEGDLLVYHAPSKTLFCGNPLITMVGPSLPWLLDGHVSDVMAGYTALSVFLRKEGSNTVTVVPGHGVQSKDTTTLREYLAYLGMLQKRAAELQSVMRNDNSAPVNMTDWATGGTGKFGAINISMGYGLYDWVHYGMNVPFATVEAGTKLAGGTPCGAVCFPPQGMGYHASGECNFCASGTCGEDGLCGGF